MIRIHGKSTLERNEQQENNTTHSQPKSKKIPQTKQTQWNNSCYFYYLTVEVESTEYQNEELLIPTLITVVGSFSF